MAWQSLKCGFTVTKGEPFRFMQNQWIQFELGGESYAHPVKTIKEVMVYQEPNPVPGNPNELEGILTIRGEVISVFNGYKLFGLNAPGNANQPPDHQSRIVCLETPNGIYGISVDAVLGIIGFEEDEIDGSQKDLNNHIRGTVHHHNQLVIVIDLAPYFDEVSNQFYKS